MIDTWFIVLHDVLPHLVGLAMMLHWFRRATRVAPATPPPQPPSPLPTAIVVKGGAL